MTTQWTKTNRHPAIGVDGSWTFSNTAKTARKQPITWHYKGYHAWVDVTVEIQQFVIHNGQEIDTTLRSAGPAVCCAAPSGGFDYTDTAVFDLQPDDVYGFRMSGSNFDLDARLIGTLSLAIPDTPQPTPSPPAQGLQPASPPAQGEPPAAQALRNSLTFRVLGNRAQLLADKLDVNVIAGCGPVTCDATVTGSIRLPGERSAPRLPAATAHLGPGGYARLRLRTSKALRRAVRRELARHPRQLPAVRVGLTARGLDGTSVHVVTTVPVRELTHPPR